MGPDGAYVTHFTAFDDEAEMAARLARLAEDEIKPRSIGLN